MQRGQFFVGEGGGGERERRALAKLDREIKLPAGGMDQLDKDKYSPQLKCTARLRLGTKHTC